MTHTYTPAESALAAAARAVLTEQCIAGGVIPIPGTSMIVAFGEREQIARLAAPSTQPMMGRVVPMACGVPDVSVEQRPMLEPSAQQAAGSIDMGNEALNKLISHIEAWAAATPAQPIAVSAPTDKRYKTAFNEWIEKTNWVQEQQDSFPFRTLGIHRADTLRHEIDRLRSAVQSADLGELRDEGWITTDIAAPVLIKKLLTIVGNAYQVAGAHDAPDHILDVLANPEEATDEQIEAMLPYVVAPVSGQGASIADWPDFWDAVNCMLIDHLDYDARQIEFKSLARTVDRYISRAKVLEEARYLLKHCLPAVSRCAVKSLHAEVTAFLASTTPQKADNAN